MHHLFKCLFFKATRKGKTGLKDHKTCNHECSKDAELQQIGDAYSKKLSLIYAPEM